ncbi:MAG: hypothetical protein IGS49_11510 [Chlorogloeopsis fritschii C42_A2020_084]|uniref:hypothetical protein n=1 Tax=Chlorogloeopsis fritschii TaxID=1124 RepID=UPI001A0BD4F5|nr:hypothetical protein [Chlorogloeopsis fritschii]MBF2006063.1 hypothetical protein [Chlorogloeopsis fritschii C42_A2020_084]
MNDLETKIIAILKRGTPLRAIEIAKILKVERREVNHYLYSSLKHLVIQDSDYRWSLKTTKINNIPHPSTQASTRPTESSQSVRQANTYRFTKQEIQQNSQIQQPTPQTQSSQPVKHTNPYEVIKRELAQASPEEKVKILKNAFRQELFRKLDDNEINALQSILEQSKREASIAHSAYQQGKLSTRKNIILAIVAISVSLALGALFAINQLTLKPTYQPTPLPQNR